MEIQIADIPTEEVALIRRTVAMSDLTGFYSEVFEAVPAAVAEDGGTVTGPPFGWYHQRPTDTVDLSAGMPVSGITPTELGEVSVVMRPGGRAVVAVHVGPYEELERTYAEVERWMAEQGVESREDMWEEYLTDPDEVPDASLWETRLVLPLR